MQTCLAYGASYGPWTLGGQFWRMFTSAFVHFGLTHLVMNMLCLLSIGCFLEKMVGHVCLFCAYVLTALTGGVLSMIFHPETVCAGASGAVFGLFGASVIYVALIWKKYRFNPSHVFGYMKNGLFFVGINFLYGFVPGVDMAAHVGGLLGGVVLGIAIALADRAAGARNKDWFGRVILTITVLLGIAMLVTVFTGRGADRLDEKELAAEVGQSIQETVLNNLKKAGETNSSVNVRDVVLYHDGGDKYHGSAAVEMRRGGGTAEVKMRLDVTYDGERFSWKNVDSERED